MKHHRFIAVIIGAAALALAACSTTGPTGPTNPGAPPGPVVTGSQTTLDEKALISAELAYNTAATAFLAADRTGQLPAALKADLGGKLIVAHKALVAARAAYAAGNAATFVEQLARVTILVDQVRQLVPASK